MARTAPQSDSYRDQVKRRLKGLTDVFARAAIGDFSLDVPLPRKEDEFTQLYVGVQVMLEVIREKMAEAQRLQDELADVLEVQTKDLERSQSRLRSIVESAPNFIHIVAPDLTVEFINRGSDETPREQIIGTKVGDFLSVNERRRVRRKLRQVLKSGQPTTYEYPFANEDGGITWFRVTAGPIYTEGVITGLVLITFDITEDKYRTRALQEGKRAAESARIRDRALINSIGEGLMVVDEHGKIATVNPAAAAMLGFRQKELVGRWFPEIIRAADEYGSLIDPLERPAIRALSSGEVVSEVVYYLRKDGSRFPVALTVSPVVIAGRPVGVVEVFRDLSRERELEQAKEEFVSLASHQLRTPATGVKAYVSMLLDGYGGEMAPRQQEFVQKVYESNERQLEIINDMLNVARVDSGRIIPEMVTSDLKALIRDIIDEQRPIIKDRRQDLEVTLPHAPVEAVLDPKLIRMAVENLVSNASKYTPEGGLIQVILKKDTKQDRATISVSDTGVGIAKSDLPRLFKRFSRIDNPLSTVRGGSGLGLYLAQNIILLHHGRVAVNSGLRRGTVFTIDLPLRARGRTGAITPSTTEVSS